MTDEPSDAAPAVVTAARALAAPMTIDAEARTALEGLSPAAVELLPGVAKTFGAVL